MTSPVSQLRSVYIVAGKEAPPSVTIVVDDCDLEPLRDDDDHKCTNEGIPSTITRETAIAGQHWTPFCRA